MKHYTPPANDQTYYITQYALTKGVVKVMGHACDTDSGRMISAVWEDSFSGRRALFHKPHWHTSLEEAEARVAAMKAAKVKSLRKALAVLETLKFDVEDRTALAGTPEGEE